MDPFGYYAEGIQQRLDDAFVEGETSSQAADQGSPSAEEHPPSVLSPAKPQTGAASPAQPEEKPAEVCIPEAMFDCNLDSCFGCVS